MLSEGQTRPPSSAGMRLREIRRQLGLSLRDVEAASRRIAAKRGSTEFYISNTRLAQLERRSAAPSIYRLASLSAIYRTTLRVLLLSFGIDCDALLPEPCPTPRTTLLGYIPQSTRSVRGAAVRECFPGCADRVDGRPGEALPNGRASDRTGHEPATRLLGAAAQHLERLFEQALAQSQGHRLAYGVVGTKDLTMFPLLKPGSGLVIDLSLRGTRKGPWPGEQDRPLYLCEIRGGYTCSWCEEEDGHIVVIPHPQSPCHVRRFARPQEIRLEVRYPRNQRREQARPPRQCAPSTAQGTRSLAALQKMERGWSVAPLVPRLWFRASGFAPARRRPSDGAYQVFCQTRTTG